MNGEEIMQICENYADWCMIKRRGKEMKYWKLHPNKSDEGGIPLFSDLNWALKNK